MWVDPRTSHVAQRTIYSVQWDVSEPDQHPQLCTYYLTKVDGRESCIFDSLDWGDSILGVS
jgi:hypothetical protein